MLLAKNVSPDGHPNRLELLKLAAQHDLDVVSRITRIRIEIENKLAALRFRSFKSRKCERVVARVTFSLDQSN